MSNTPIENELLFACRVPNFVVPIRVCVVESVSEISESILEGCSVAKASGSFEDWTEQWTGRIRESRGYDTQGEKGIGRCACFK